MNQTPPSSSQRWGLPLTIIAIGAIVAGAFMLQQATSRTALPAATPTVADPAVAGVRIAPGIVKVDDADPVLGSASAPHTLFLFTQWQCSFCRHFFDATFPQLKEHYIDTGRVRLVFKAFPIGNELQDTEEAQQVAQAAYCAHQQGAFWPYIRHLFAVGARYELDSLRQYAARENLDEDRLVACLQAEEYAELVTHNIRAAVAAGITATPSFVINDQLWEGELSYQELERILSQSL